MKETTTWTRIENKTYNNALRNCKWLLFYKYSIRLSILNSHTCFEIKYTMTPRILYMSSKLAEIIKVQITLNHEPNKLC